MLQQACGTTGCASSAPGGGAGTTRKTGEVLPEETFVACRDARHPARRGRPARGHLSPTAPRSATTCTCGCASGSTSTPTSGRSGSTRASRSPLAGWQAGQIDYVIVRENTEGLYASRGAGVHAARRARDRHAGRHPQGHRARGAILLRTRAPPQRRAARRQAPRHRLRQGQHPAHATPSSAPSATKSRRTIRDVEIDYAYADAITVHMREAARLLRRDRRREHVRRHHLRPRRGDGRRPRHLALGRTRRRSRRCSRARTARPPTSPARTPPARSRRSCRAR